MDVLEKAIVFAVKAHSGQLRKMSRTPYILHPLEVAAIIATMTDDRDTMAAGILHDTVEDCGVTPETIREEFGSRVYALVMSETEDKLLDRPAAETWQERKSDSLLMLKHTGDDNVRIMWLADKLSNVRSFYRAYLKDGSGIWDHLHQKDPKMQEWYYRTVAEYVSGLSDTAAYREYTELLDKLFEGEQHGTCDR